MSSWFPVAILLVALAVPATGSTLEDASAGFVSYQFDGDTAHDAPDTCAAASPEWRLESGSMTDGLLLPPDDHADVYVLDVPRSDLGKRLDLDVLQPHGMPSLQVTAFAPGCSGSVVEMVNWPTPEPSPPAPHAGETQHSADVSEPWRCDSRQWLFVITSLHGYADPASIHVAWTDGTEHALPLSGRYGDFAAYATGENLGILLKGAWANLPATWDGTFGLAVGPCDAVDGGAVYGEPPSLGEGFLSFTPTRAGLHIVQVTFDGATGHALMPIPAPVTFDPEPLMPFETHEFAHDPVGTLLGVAQDPTALASADVAVPDVFEPIVVPATCHACIHDSEGVVAKLSYLLFSNSKAD